MQNTLKVSHWNSPKPIFVKLERKPRVATLKFTRDRKGRFAKKWHEYISPYWWKNIALVLLMPGLWSYGYLLNASNTQKEIMTEATHQKYIAYLQRECSYGRAHPEKYSNVSDLLSECKKNNVK